MSSGRGVGSLLSCSLRGLRFVTIRGNTQEGKSSIHSVVVRYPYPDANRYDRRGEEERRRMKVTPCNLEILIERRGLIGADVRALRRKLMFQGAHQLACIDEWISEDNYFHQLAVSINGRIDQEGPRMRFAMMAVKTSSSVIGTSNPNNFLLLMEPASANASPYN